MLNESIVIGIHGPRGSGKTTLARELAPPGSTMGSDKLLWSHLNFAMPLRSMLKAKQMTEGYKQEDRILYQLHDILVDVLGNSPLYGAPPYDELVQIVYEIAEHSIDDGEDKVFMQYFGEALRQRIHEDVWVDWVEKKVKSDIVAAAEDVVPVFVISDVRHENEYEFIRSAPHNMMINLTVDSNVLLERLLDRDGRLPSKRETSHVSEHFKLNESNLGSLDISIDTTDIGPSEAAKMVRAHLHQMMGVTNA